MTQVGTGDYVPPSGIALSERFPEWAHCNVTHGEYGALFAVRRMLEEDPGGEFVGFSHWRRFAASRDVAPRREISQMIDPAGFEALSPEVFLGDGKTVLTAPMVTFGMTVLQQYSLAHLTRDLLRFMALAVDREILTDAEVAAFLSRPGFIPTSTVSVVPTPWAVTTLTTLEEIAVAFEKEGHIPREGYQQRVIGFCLERLHAVLTERLLGDVGPQRRRLHLSMLVSVDGRNVPTQ